MVTPAYEYAHVVSLEETNAFGNVYFTHFLRWQGRCREMFLREYAPEVLAGARGLHLVTTRCACEYFAELAAFDSLTIRMHASEINQNRITLSFEYWRSDAAGKDLVARGEQEVAWLVKEGDQYTPTRIPPVLLAAIDRAVAAHQTPAARTQERTVSR
jgi:enediyne biosynthesis thioesterase